MQNSSLDDHDYQSRGRYSRLFTIKLNGNFRSSWTQTSVHIMCCKLLNFLQKTTHCCYCPKEGSAVPLPNYYLKKILYLSLRTKNRTPCLLQVMHGIWKIKTCGYKHGQGLGGFGGTPTKILLVLPPTIAPYPPPPPEIGALLSPCCHSSAPFPLS